MADPIVHLLAVSQSPHAESLTHCGRRGWRSTISPPRPRLPCEYFKTERGIFEATTFAEDVTCKRCLRSIAKEIPDAR